MNHGARAESRANRNAPQGNSLARGERTPNSRIVASAEWNGLAEHRTYGATMPTITVADATAPAKIAQAIARRLLPGYLPLLAQAAERTVCFHRLPTVNALSDGTVRFCGSRGFECSLDRAFRILDILAEDATE